METIPDATLETNECFNVTIYVPEMSCALNVILGKKNTATVCLCDSSSEYAVIKHSCYVAFIVQSWTTTGALYSVQSFILAALKCTEVQLCVTACINTCGLRTCYI